MIGQHVPSCACDFLATGLSLVHDPIERND